MRILKYLYRHISYRRYYEIKTVDLIERFTKYKVENYFCDSSATLCGAKGSSDELHPHATIYV